MHCFNARRHFADSIEGVLAADTGRRLRDHLASCARCASEHEALAAIALAVGDAGRAIQTPAPGDFETRLFAAIRTRSQAPAARWALPAALPLAVSVLIMIAAAVLSLTGSGPARSVPLPAPGLTAGALPPDAAGDDAVDRLAPPEEIPFTLDEDLVGTRRGRIPATTYVLEPAPEERAVLRASL